jgi:hypothetical protein
LEVTTSILTSSPDWVNAADAGIGAVSDGDYILMLDSYKAMGPDGVEYAEAGVRTTITGLSGGETYLITVDASSLRFSTAWGASGYLDAYLGSDGSSALNLLSTNHVTDQQLYEAFIHTGGTFGTCSYSFVANAEEMEFGLRSRVSDPDGVDFWKTIRHGNR